MKTTTITKKIMLIVTLITTVITTAVVLLIGSGYSWFTDTRTTKVKINSSVLGSYFQSGSGTKKDPYEVRTPIQLYYLAWLQDLGAFNTTYEENGVTHINQYHFYLSADLDMSDYILPPIGTTKFPFVGNFDGQDTEGNYHKISNLTVSNIRDLTDVPFSTDETIPLNSYQIVGFFGIIGSVDGVTDNTYDTTGETPTLTSLGSVTIGDNTYTYNSEANEVKNFLLDTCTIESKIPTDNKTLVGIAAGYVAGYMYSVGVYNCSIELNSSINVLDSENVTNKKSAYTLIGYSQRAVEEYMGQQAGTGSDWGGSVDMMSAYNRLTYYYGTTERNEPGGDSDTIYNNIATKKTNIKRAGTGAYMFYDESGNYVDSYLPTASTGTFVVYDTNTTAGSFMFAKRSSNNDYSNNYYYLTGGVRYSISREYYYANQTAYTFSDSSSTYYLYYDFVNNKIVSSNSEQGKWFVNNNAYYVQKNTIPSNSPSTNYYIGRDNYGRVSLTTTSTTWSINNNHLYNGSQYLVHINGLNGGFGLSDNAYIYKINYNGNYLNYSTPTAITTGTSQTDATEWIVTGNYIHTVINDTTYFLTVSNNQLTLSTNPSTTFAISNNKITYNNLSLVYENGSWKFRNDYYLITDGTYYLNEDLSSTTVASNATRWYNQSGKLFTDNNIYLYNNNGTLSTTTSENAANSWTISSNTIYNGDYYLTYIDGFRLVGPRYYIRSGNNYLTYDGSIGNQASQTDASKWAISNGSSIGGYIFTLYNGNEYYLYNNSGTLSVTNDKNTATNWSISNGTPTNNGYALQYDNGWTLKADYKTISGTYNNRTYYMYLNGNSITANQSNSTQFIFIESADGTIIKNATASQYLYNNNGTLALTNSESNATKWSKDNNIFYDGKYFIDCNGTNWVLTRFMYYLYDSQVDNDGTTYPYYFTGTGSNNGTRAGSTTSQSSATTYYLNDNNTISPTSNTNYYLYRSGNDVYIGSNANNRFTFDSSTNYLKTGNYYVYYSPSNSRFRNGTNYQDTFEFIKANGFTITINQISINSLTYNTVSNPTCNANVTDIPGNSYSRSQIYALRANSTGKLLSYRTSNFQYSDTYYVDYSTDLIDYNTAYATYFPINADPENGYQAVNSNTGYIIAGGNLQNNESGYQGSGDIRISRYSISGNISASLSGSTLNDSAVYTINGDGLKTITTAGGSEIFQKYSSSKSDFEETLALDTSYVYGLHFMDSTITVKELVTAKHVLINGETIDNYQMPADSIDFTLKEKGYINFFAGTYFPNNDSFFSLHKIVRDDNPQSATYRQITNIKEILQVWGESNQDEAQYAKYIYKVLDSKTGQTYYEYTNGYKEGIYVGTQESDLPDSYELKFDTNWIKISGNVQGITKSGNNTSGTGYIYYFEVPADSGEYALGSVPGGKGAYLLYLDIAANAGDVEKDVMDYIKGVDFVKTNETSILDTIRNNAPTATFAIKDSFAYSDNQKVTISRSDSTEGNITTITFTITGSTANQSENMRYYYVDDDTGQKRYVFVFEPSS